MNTQKEKKSLIICLITELIIIFIGFVFFNPFPIDGINKSLIFKFATLILYFATCSCGIYAAKVADLYDDNIHMAEIIIMCIVMAFIIASLWPFILGAIIIFTVALLLTTDKRSSNS